MDSKHDPEPTKRSVALLPLAVGLCLLFISISSLARDTNIIDYPWWASMLVLAGAVGLLTAALRVRALLRSDPTMDPTA